MKNFTVIFLYTLLIGSVLLVSSCDDEDDDSDCLVCEAYNNGLGTTLEAIDLCPDGETVTEETLELARAAAEGLGATCN